MLRFLGILGILVLAHSHYTLAQKSGNPKPTGLEYAKPWEYGANTCAYLTRPGIIDYKVYTYCLPWKQDYCGDVTEFKYDCCPGFIRSEAFDNKCVEHERSWMFIPEHLNASGFPNFVQYLTNNFKEFSSKLATTKEAFTIFVPYKDINSTQDTKTLGHPAEGIILRDRVYASSLQNGMTLETLNSNYLKVTKYANGAICVECRELVEPDHEARNGLIHFLSDKIDVTQQKTVLDTLKDKPHFSEFLGSLPKKLKDTLGSSCSKWYTVFAPDNTVWAQVKKNYPANLLEKIAANHVVSGLYCKAALVKTIKNLGPTESGEYLNVGCDGNGNREISSNCNYTTVINKNNPEIMASNGVIYMVNDKPLVPVSALSLKTYLSDYSCPDNADKDWIKALKTCDLRMKEGKKYAVLIPTTKAMKWWADYSRFRSYLAKFQTDEEFRCRLIRFHIMEMDDLKAGRLESLLLQPFGFRTNNVDELYEINYFLKREYGSELFFLYSPVDKLRSVQFKDGSIYKINRVNMIPEKNITTILKDRQDLQDSHSVVQYTKSEEKIFTPKKPLNLFLAIKNGTWKENMTNLTEDSASIWLKLHWVNLQLWDDDIGYFDVVSRHRFMSGVGLELIFDRRSDGFIYIGWEGLDREKWAQVVETNLFGTDGMVWIIDRPIECPAKYCPMEKKKPLLEKEIWTVLVFSCWDVYDTNSTWDPKKISQNIEKWLYLNPEECYTFKQIPKSETKEHSSQL